MDRPIVTVSRDSIEGYAEPEFILEHEGKVYITLALLEYDPGDPDLDDDKRADLEELQAMLEQDRDVTGIVSKGRGRPSTSAQTHEDND